MSKQTDPSSLFIGLDLGTSGCRAIAINLAGTIIAQASFEYPKPKTQSEQDWWLASEDVLKNLLSQINPQKVKAIAVDGTSSSVLLCDENGDSLTPVMMYNDQRATQQAHDLQQYAPISSIVLNPTSGLAKVLWLIENYPVKDNFHIVNQADWLAGKLCHSFNFSDVNNALKTGFDPNNNVWPQWLINLFKQRNINISSLPKVISNGSVIKNIHPDIALDLGLSTDVEIVAGTTDSTAAFMASNATNVGQAVTSLGSTLVLKVISDIEVNSPAHGVYSQPYGKHWLVGGASNSGGAVLKHYFSKEQMQALTKQLKPNLDTQLNYYPLLKAGERFPVNDPLYQPKLTRKGDDDAVFFQGLLEGIAEIEHTGYKLLQELGAPYPTSVQTAGGGAINKAWQEIRQQKLGVPVTASTHSAAAYGVAKLATQNYI